MFSPQEWAAKFRANADAAERNSLMDSGWSASVADACQQQAMRLYSELFQELKEVSVLPSDIFDRPALAAVLAAVHEASRPERSRDVPPAS